MTRARGNRRGLLRDVGPLVWVLAALCWSFKVCAVQSQQQEDWALPANAAAHGQLAVKSWHKDKTGVDGRSRLSQSTRRLLTPSRQSKLTAGGAGMLPYQPTGFQIDGADLTQFFMEAHSNHNVTGIRLSPGTYHVIPKVGDGYHLHLPCTLTRTAAFEVDFSGVFFYFTDHRLGGTWLERCSNVDLHGPYEQTWTAEELDFTQGTILTMDNTSTPHMATVQVDDGYPSDRILLRERISVITFLSDTLLVKNQPCPDLATPDGLDHRQKLAHNIYQFAYLPGCAGAPRDLFVARGNTSTMGLLVDSCDHTFIRDLSIYHAGSFALFQTNGSNNTFMGIQVRPYPHPLGNDGKPPLLSSNADTFHAANAHRGTTVRDCYFVNAGDDGIAMHGQYYAVVQTNLSQHSMVIASGGGIGFDRNDTLTFYGKDTVCKGSSTVKSLHSVIQPDSTQGKVNPVLSDLKPFAYDDCDFMEVKMASWPESFDNILVDDVVASPSANGNGFAILNNTIGNLRGRAMIIKSSDGLIAGNTLFNLMHFAIELAPEWAWQEADFVRNVTVRDNLINTNGTGIWLGIDPWHWKGPPAHTNNYGVDFLRNTIVNVRQSPFVVTSAAQVTLKDTSFINVLCHGNDTQYFTWAPAGSLVALANVDGVSIEGTQIHNNELCPSPSGDYAQPVSEVNATHVQGMLPADSAAATVLQGDEFT